LVPYMGPSGEQKTKPTQHSVTELRARGIQPDVIVARSADELNEDVKRKISNLCDVPEAAVITAADADTLYEIPLILHDQGLDVQVCEILRIDTVANPIDLTAWQSLVHRIKSANRTVRIGLIGKYVNLVDAYLSVVESLRHAGWWNGARVEIDWIQAEQVPDLLATDPNRFAELDGIVIPGGFGERGIEGKIAAARWARMNNVPCLGLCLGMQVMVIEAARDLLGLSDATSTEFNPDTPDPVIDLMEDQRTVTDKGGTMRLGLYPARLLQDSIVAKAYGEPVVYERHRHRWEVNPRYHRRLLEAGVVISGLSPDGRLAEFVELAGHPYWVGTQAHPEFLSRPNRPHPLFRELISASLRFADGRAPRLLDLELLDDVSAGD
jgi:CTP synthase